MEWISVKDKWPPDGQAVILCIEIDYSVGYIYTSGAFVGGRWKLNESHDLLDTDCYEYSDGSYDNDITHWMPLPPPPSSSNSDYTKSCYDCIYGVDGCQHEPPCTTGTGKPYYKKRDFA